MFVAQEAALISQRVSSMALRAKPPEWLAVKAGGSLTAARRRTSGSTASHQHDDAMLVRCICNTWSIANDMDIRVLQTLAQAECLRC
jgi:hypothetical protein